MLNYSKFVSNRYIFFLRYSHHERHSNFPSAVSSLCRLVQWTFKECLNFVRQLHRRLSHWVCLLWLVSFDIQWRDFVTAIRQHLHPTADKCCEYQLKVGIEKDLLLLKSFVVMLLPLTAAALSSIYTKCIDTLYMIQLLTCLCYCLKISKLQSAGLETNACYMAVKQPMHWYIFLFYLTSGLNGKKKDLIPPTHSTEFLPLWYCTLTAESLPHYQNTMISVTGYSRWTCV